MKRFWAIALVLFMLTIPALAEENNWNALSLEELQNVLFDIHVAIASKSLDVGENKVIIGKDDFYGYQLVLGKAEWDNGNLEIYLTVINDSPYSMQLSSYTSSVNGWALSSASEGSQTAPGERSKNTASITLRDLEEKADVTSLEDIDIIRVQMSLNAMSESGNDYVYCAFYLIRDGAGGFVVSSAKFSETYTEVTVF